MNISFEQRTIPKNLKTSIVRPIHKGGAKGKIENYRPISILPVVGKCWEIYSGFQNGSSTEKLLGEMVNFINMSLDKSQHILLTFVDFSKAFDTLSHEKIRESLYRIGIRGKIAEWVQNHLLERTIKVRIPHTDSSIKSSQFGVPQGSKLGPVLFILYSIIVNEDNLEKARETMQMEFDNLSRWCHDHIPTPNKPTYPLYIYHQNKDCPTSRRREPIEVVRTIKYIVIIIDDQFIWQNHINRVRLQLKSTALGVS